LARPAKNIVECYYTQLETFE